MTAQKDALSRVTYRLKSQSLAALNLCLIFMPDNGALVPSAWWLPHLVSKLRAGKVSLASEICSHLPHSDLPNKNAPGIMATNSIKLLTGNSHPALAKLVADRLGIELAKILVVQYSNQETSVTIGESVRDEDGMLPSLDTSDV
jgi:hypothetical protein